jgi:hypothetical protein
MFITHTPAMSNQNDNFFGRGCRFQRLWRSRHGGRIAQNAGEANISKIGINGVSQGTGTVARKLIFLESAAGKPQLPLRPELLPWQPDCFRRHLLRPAFESPGSWRIGPPPLVTRPGAAGPAVSAGMD